MSTQITKAKFGTIPSNITDVMQMAKVFSNSELVPRQYQQKADNIVVAWAYGASIGLNAMSSLQNIAVINGRPCIWGDAALALVRQSGLLEYISEDYNGTCKIKRKNQPEVVVKFTMEDAQKAGINNSAIWKTYPKRMLQMRARSWALRDVFGDVLSGMQIAEEVQDYKDSIDTFVAPEVKEKIMLNDVVEHEQKPEVIEECENEYQDYEIMILDCKTQSEMTKLATSVLKGLTHKPYYTKLRATYTEHQKGVTRD